MELLVLFSIVLFAVLAYAPEEALQIILAGTWALMIIAGIAGLLIDIFR